MTPTILAIESSSSACSVAIGSVAGVLCHLRSGQRNQAEALIPLVAEAMRSVALSWQDIDLIAVAVGPGSFTGLRIGVAAARGLALAAGIRLIGIGTASVLVHAVPPPRRQGRELLVAIDSKRDDIFVQPFDADGLPLAPIRSATPQDALVWRGGPLLVAGDAAELFRGLRPDLEIVPLVPSAADLLAVAGQDFDRGGGLPAQPLYVRAPDVSLPRPV